MYFNSALALLGKDKESFDNYFPYLSDFHVPNEVSVLLQAIEKYYQSGNEKIDWEDFRSWFHVEENPTLGIKQHQVYDTYIDHILTAPVDSGAIQRVFELKKADEIQSLVSEIRTVSNSESFEDIIQVSQSYLDDRLVTGDDHIVDMDIDTLVKSVILGDGIEWRLEGLNTSLGQVHKGDFLLVVKRPETGGTTFLTSEFTHMLKQLPEGKSAIIFNNEEGGSKLGLRVVQSALGITAQEINRDPRRVQKEWDKFLNGRKILVYDPPDGLTTQKITDFLNKNPECWLIGINVLDKVGGFYKHDEVQRQRKLAEWARNTAKNHGVVVAVLQADGSAEGQQFMNQSQVYGSKTGVQGEADGMIMIGRDVANDTIRYISVAKNKKPTTGRMEAALRHAQFACAFDQDRGRFT